MVSFKPKACVIIPALCVKPFSRKAIDPFWINRWFMVAEILRAVKNIYVATEDNRIANVVREAGFANHIALMH